MQGMQGTYSIAFETNVDGETGDMEVDTKPKVEKKVGTKRKKKLAESDSDEDVFDNKLEDNPSQVNILNVYIYIKNLQFCDL